MKKIFKYIIISFLFLLIIYSPNVMAKSNVKLLDYEEEVEVDNTGSFKSGTLVFVEIFCGIIGVGMIIFAMKPEDGS